MSEASKIILSCANCSTELVEVWVKNSIDKRSPIRAECCYCNDRSYVVEIIGDFYIGGTDKTSIADIQEKNGTTIIKTARTLK